MSISSSIALQQSVEQILQWVAEEPDLAELQLTAVRESLRKATAPTFEIIVTVLESPSPVVSKRRSFNSPLAGKVEILGDLVSPIVDEEDWECLK